MNKLKIVYISRSIIPSKTANSINVMKMCEAFALLGHKVTLLAPITKKLEEKQVEDIYEFYGVKNYQIL
jgi:2-oxoglutarate dehydrogenase complex dehydrogenase (E1) component-like enzyme